jgi:2-methylcitrate dehydratase PrpD
MEVKHRIWSQHSPRLHGGENLGRANTLVNDQVRDVGLEFGEHVAGTTFEDLPEDTRAITKLSILDTVGVMLAASGLIPDAATLHEFAVDLGGKPESTVLGFGTKLPAPAAAFVNGGMAHCLDYDDFHLAGVHPSTPTVPCGIAMGERVAGTSGKALLTAIALGNDFSTRLSASVADSWETGWYTTPLFGYFSAATVAAKLLRLDAQQTSNALGIAFMQAGGTLQGRHGGGSDIASISAGWPNRAGVVAALLAQKGIGGVGGLFEGKAGFFPVYFAGKYDRGVLTEDLGKVFRGTEVTFKAWPACALTHGAIEATTQLVAEHGVRPEEIAAITVRYGREAFSALGEPLHLRQKPPTAMDAKFSFPFTVAIAAVNGRLGLSDFTAPALVDEAVLAVAAKTTSEFDPGIGTVRGSAEVEIQRLDGSTCTARIERPYGQDPERPMTEVGVIDKFRECASFAVTPLPARSIDRIVELITNLEAVGDVREITALLSSEDY